MSEQMEVAPPHAALKSHSGMRISRLVHNGGRIHQQWLTIFAAPCYLVSACMAHGSIAWLPHYLADARIEIGRRKRLRKPLIRRRRRNSQGDALRHGTHLFEWRIERLA